MQPRAAVRRPARFPAGRPAATRGETPTPFAVPATTIPIAGSAMAFPVRRIDCIGRKRAMGDEKKPWEIGKSFDKSAPIGEIHPVDKIGGHFSDGAIWLKVNGTPENVGPVVRGDVIEIHIDRLPNLSVKIV